jgi:hypothetical protein
LVEEKGCSAFYPLQCCQQWKLVRYCFLLTLDIDRYMKG